MLFRSYECQCSTKATHDSLFIETIIIVIILRYNHDNGMWDKITPWYIIFMQKRKLPIFFTDNEF